jgi:hypothetical protein
MRASDLARSFSRVPMAAITTGAFVLGLALGYVLFGGEERVASAPAAEPPAPVAATPAPPSPAPEPTPAVPEPTPEPLEPVSTLSGPGLDIESTPPGATFFVNGKKIGKAPSQVLVKKGRLKVSATKPGYKRWFRVMWHTKDLTKVKAKLERK